MNARLDKQALRERLVAARRTRARCGGAGGGGLPCAAHRLADEDIVMPPFAADAIAAAVPAHARAVHIADAGHWAYFSERAQVFNRHGRGVFSDGAA